ncbi:MAG: M1 family metallopeptidase [Candidatus Micrarchaeaceae archaeon]
MEEYSILGGSAIPLNYNIELIPDLKKFIYAGNETIKLRIAKPTKSISLNSKEIKIKEAYAVSKGSKQRARISYNTKKEMVTFSFGKAVSGTVDLNLSFTGIHNDNMCGFYRSYYTDKKGKRQYMLSSHFESTSARNAFPCFDEPSFKATFDISMIIDKGLEAVSNMPVKSTKGVSASKKKVIFNTTPKMSTYLVYLGVSKYDRVSSNLGKLKVSVLTVPGKGKYAGIALDYAKRFIAFYQKYFGIEYPLPKVDLLAIPDFAAGAMENWGAITFREVALLCSSDSSLKIKRYIADTVAHELAHQWFGDLVTMKWWNDLWLNESFATFMSCKARDHEFPEWHVFENFLDENLGSALVQDQLKDTHPINVEVKTPGEIDALFDAISYQKGASVLNMVNDYVGESAFRKGLSIYLKAHAYSNAAKEDLWGALEKASKETGSGKRVNYLMDKWITKAGYPELSVSKAATHINIAQRRSFLSKRMHGNGIWPIPLHYKFSNGDTGFMLMDKPRASISAGGAEWAKLNYGQKGVYRVLYSDKMLENLGAAVKSKKLSGMDIWGILNDFFYLARSGRKALNEYVAYVSRYMFNAGAPASLLLNSQLNFLYSLCYNKSFSSGLKNAKQRFAELKYSELGWQTRKNDTPQERELRDSIISSLGVAEYAPIVSKANRLFADIISGKKVNPDIHQGIYIAAAWNGNASTFGKLVSLYKRTDSQEDKRAILIALGMQKSPQLIKKALELSLSQDIRLQDSFIIPSVIAGSPTGSAYIWPWLKGKWQDLMKKYPTTTLMLSRFVDMLSMQSDPSTREDIAAFFSAKKNMRDDIKKSVPKVLEKIDANIEFMKTNS